MSNVTKFEPADFKGKILIVDDSDVDRNVINKILKRYYIKEDCILTAENGQIAMDILSKESINLVFMDIRMPIQDGFQTIKLMKEHSDFKEIPIIVLTSINEKEMVVQILAQKVEDYIIKPIIDKIKFWDKIKPILERIYFEMTNETNLMKQTETINRLIDQYVLQNVNKTAHIFTLDKKYWDNLGNKFSEIDLNIFNRLKALDKDYKNSYPSCIIVDFHLGKDRIYSYLQDMKYFLDIYNIKVILTFDIEMQEKTLPDDEKKVLNEMGVTDFFNKGNNFVPMYEKK